MIQSIEEGRKEDGNRSIADKIIKRLHDLDKTVESNQGRWAWELLQNAKDSIAEDDEKSVSVQIELGTEFVEFRHNGTHFTERDVRGLINQISSKEVEEGQVTKRTGKFGTGFLTTHLLSRVIHVRGIVETTGGDLYKFGFPLDREGKTTTALIPKIEKAWSEFHNSATPIAKSYDKDDFNTSFRYELKTEEQRRIAQVGIREFLELVQFVLAFNSKIGKIEVIDNVNHNDATFERKGSVDNNIVQISRGDIFDEEQLFILAASDEKVIIGAQLQKIGDSYSVCGLENVPKLFCDFPLIGTEEFNFPLLVNSFYFNPLTERDGIWLKKEGDKEVNENRALLLRALELYKKMLLTVSEANYTDLYNIVNTQLPKISDKYLDEAWYIQNIQRPLRKFVVDVPLVELEEEVDSPMKPLKDMWFPLRSYPKNTRERIWQFTYDQFNTAVCKKAHLHNWCRLSWEAWQKLDFSEVCKDVATHKNVETLASVLKKDEKSTFKWLNDFGQFILDDETNHALTEKHYIVPNQAKHFKPKSALYIDKISDRNLVDILRLLGEDWNNILLHKKVSFGTYFEKSRKDIASKITDALKNQNLVGENRITAISLLSEWFENNREEGKELFSELYRKRAELFMNTIRDKESLYKVMRSSVELSKLAELAKSIEQDPTLIDNYERAEELNNLLREYNVNSIDELKHMLKSARIAELENAKTEISQETLASLGITTAEELEKALQDRHLAARFHHTSTPRVEAYLYAQALISRSKKNVVEYLESLSEYNCSEMEELAPTVIGGIRKEGLPIHVVIRPSDHGEVIVYSSSEKDTLDYENAELWIDNGKESPRLLTLGKILKTTGINKIPV